jgi:hypothetical protein
VIEDDVAFVPTIAVRGDVEVIYIMISKVYSTEGHVYLLTFWYKNGTPAKIRRKGDITDNVDNA